MLFEPNPSNPVEVTLDACLATYEPKSLLIRSGLWVVDAQRALHDTEIEIQLAYRDRGDIWSVHCLGIISSAETDEVAATLYTLLFFTRWTTDCERAIEESFES